MNELTFDKELFEVFDKLREHGPHLRQSDLLNELENRNIHIPAEQLPDFALKLARFNARQYGYIAAPKIITLFIEALLSEYKAKTLCDPWAGIGALLSVAQRVTTAESCFALTPNASDGQYGTYLFPKAKWIVGNTLDSITKIDSPLDIVVSILPFGLRTKEEIEISNTEGKIIKIKGELGDLVLSIAISKIQKDGIGIFVVTPSFFFRQNSVFFQFSELGYGIEAAFHVPPATFAHTGIPTYLIVVRKQVFEKTFVAQLTDSSKTNTQILNNYRSKQNGGLPELGRHINIFEFKSIDALRSDEYFEEAQERYGCPSASLNELSKQINLGKHGQDFMFKDSENSIYIPLIGNSGVVDCLDDLTLKQQNYIQAVIDSNKSKAQFVAKFLNSELGKKIREWNKSGVTIPKLNKQSICSLPIFILPLKKQQETLELDSRISSEENTLLTLQNELSEIKRALWKSPKSQNEIDKRITVFSEQITKNIKKQADISLEQWFETLPFPLASILRSWQATSIQDFKRKYEHLLNFFEATAEFVSIILLSAFKSNTILFEEHRKKLSDSMKKQNISFVRATFGTWKIVVEYFGKQTRILLNDKGKKDEKAKNNRDICKTIFADDSLGLPNAVSSKLLVNIFGTTNKMRNDWIGHGGVVGQEEAKRRNDALLTELVKCREAMGDIWPEYNLINSLHCRYKGGVFENEIALLKGSNNEFLKKSYALATCLDVERLYIIKEGSKKPLELLPLIKIGPSPETTKNACYFYNRIEKGGSRFVSYHFQDQPELTGDFEDATEAIRNLTKQI